MANRLAKETSPYLLQHKNNPVDWHPWGEEALARARSENKPILLSIGYSACHWCHVMEHESFENSEIAQQMNEGFINIKVDREERPDLDHIYQNVAQVMTQGGGWPLTVFLTPDLRPFYGGTYFPPEDRYGRPGFKKVLSALSNAFQKDFEVVSANAEKLTEIVSSLESVTASGERVHLKEFHGIAEKLLSHVDGVNGGLGGAPKFPNPMIFSFLWRYGIAVDSEKAWKAALLALTRMASGGVYDQLGGGFHRYSVDASWSIPHFEKMLYDNALLLKLYSEVLLTANVRENALSDSERNLFLNVLLETTDYLYREMQSPEGVFYSAQDADSEGEEGKYFVWDLNDLSKELTPDEKAVFAMRYGISEEGNFENGKTVLYVASSLDEVASKTHQSQEQVSRIIESARRKLLAVRKQRIAPGLDNKVLTSWNALMVSGLAWTSQALRLCGKTAEANRAFESAEKAFRFLKDRVTRDGDRLYSTFQGGQPKLNGYLDDSAFMAMAALDLSRFSKDIRDVKKYQGLSRDWLRALVKHFKDPVSVGYFFTSDDHEKLIQRPKTIFDQAIPSGTAVALTCMIALSELGEGNEIFDREIESQVPSLLQAVKTHAFGMGELLCMGLLKFSGPITVAGNEAESFSQHPHVFRKGDSFEGILVCHKQTCSLPLTLDEAKVRIAEIVRNSV